MSLVVEDYQTHKTMASDQNQEQFSFRTRGTQKLIEQGTFVSNKSPPLGGRRRGQQRGLGRRHNVVLYIIMAYRLKDTPTAIYYI